MPGQVISLHAGQCGNQVGLEYWTKLAADHHINADGTMEAPDITNDTLNNLNASNPNNTPLGRPATHPDLFFTLSDSISSTKRYTPRAVLIDMEPSVISKSTTALPMFSSRSVHVSPNGHGAANNWSHGYSYGNENAEAILDYIDRECDKCDTVSAFQLFHSVAGGTGAGVGLMILELLADKHPKKLVPTFLVFPLSERALDVVVQPYNTVLTLQRLIEFALATFVFDNDALTTIENNLYGMKDTLAFAGANKLIAHVAATILNPLRFPTYMYLLYDSILSSLIPTPDLKFLTSLVTPRISSGQNEHDILLELCSDKYKMHRVQDGNGVSNLRYLAILDFLPRLTSQTELKRGILKAQNRVQFVPWATKLVFVVLSGESDSKFAGSQVSNNTLIAQVLARIVKQYDLLAKREAYVNYYTSDNSAESRAAVMETFREAKDAVVSTIDEYKECQLETYLDD